MDVCLWVVSLLLTVPSLLPLPPSPSPNVPITLLRMLLPAADTAGYRTAVLSSNALGAGSCTALTHPFNSPATGCGSMDQRVLAIDTDATCAVRIYVLGDSSCSAASSLTAMAG